MNLKEEIINHVDSGDLILDILEAQEEFDDDKHGLGVRVANILNDFKDKVEAEPKRGNVYAGNPMATMKALARYARGDHDLKQSKEL